MKILITGASGFIGRHLVAELLNRGHQIIAVSRNQDRVKELPWFNKVTFISHDIHKSQENSEILLPIPDILIHLAWPGLPNYNDSFHLKENFPADSHFLKRMITAGTKRVLVTGTCLEYGLQSGALTEDMLCQPITAYGQAKNKLREFLQNLQVTQPFTLQWIRLFYMYGPGQNKNSLIAQLDEAIKNKDSLFNMSSGDQIRDYLPIETVAKYIASIAENPRCSGIVNCCSGQPISVRALVEEIITEKGAKIKLNLGHYPYPTYEPMAFWGENAKLQKYIQKI